MSDSSPQPPAVPPPPAPAVELGPEPPFEFNEDRKFSLYMQQRESHSKGARDAYQRFDQTIVGLSAGAIVLSLTFLKDFGRSPQSLPWLFFSWGFFLLASLSAFLSLLTSGEADREQMKQLDCQVETGECDTKKSERLGRATVIFNYTALTLCILGVIFIIVFATKNLLQGGEQWQRNQAAPEVHQPGNSSPKILPADIPKRLNGAPSQEETANTNPARKPSTATASPLTSPKKPTQGTASPRH